MSEITPPPGGPDSGPDPIAWDPLAPPRPQPGSIHDLPYADPDDPLDVARPSIWARAPRLPKLGRGGRRGSPPNHEPVGLPLGGLTAPGPSAGEATAWPPLAVPGASSLPPARAPFDPPAAVEPTPLAYAGPVEDAGPPVDVRPVEPPSLAYAGPVEDAGPAEPAPAKYAGPPEDVRPVEALPPPPVAEPPGPAPAGLVPLTLAPASTPPPADTGGRLPPPSALPPTMWEPTYQPSERATAPTAPPPPGPTAATGIDWAAPWSTDPSGPPPPPGAPALPGPGGAPAPTTPPRVAEGVLVGVAAAGVAGVAWWAVAALTERQFVYLAVLLGFLVGRGVVVGARRGAPVLGAFAFAVTLVALACAEYFIQRSLAISTFHTAVPLWSGFDFAREVVRSSITDDPLNAVFWLLAAGIAGFQAALPHAKPVL